MKNGRTLHYLQPSRVRNKEFEGLGSPTTLDMYRHHHQALIAVPRVSKQVKLANNVHLHDLTWKDESRNKHYV